MVSCSIWDARRILDEETSAHGQKLVIAPANEFVGWVQPTIRLGVMVGCTHPTPEVITNLGP